MVNNGFFKDVQFDVLEWLIMVSLKMILHVLKLWYIGMVSLLPVRRNA